METIKGVIKIPDGKGGWKKLPTVKGDKGDKGDPFVYEDFTQSQLAILKGDKGDRGEVGPPGQLEGASAIVVGNYRISHNYDTNSLDIEVIE